MKKTTKFAPNLHLKRARVQRGWSQEYVAREVGTDAFTVSRWERGVAMASPHFRQQLCALFGLSATELGHSLVGRDGLFRQLKQRLLSENPVALSAINGLPGVGKTALATALAHVADHR